MKCDLHVHTVHSGMCTIPLLKRVCRESYTDPEALYRTLKRRGMNLVTVTDHDSIAAAESLRRHSDFFLSEEVSCQMPSGTLAHVGVYDITEQQHVEIQRRRNDFPALMAYCDEQRLFASINHIFSSLTGPRDPSDFEWFAEAPRAFETRNGQMLASSNRQAARLARWLGKASVGGSDAHTLHGAGRTWTEVPGARSRQEFWEALRLGQGRVRGESGRYGKLTRDVFQIAAHLMGNQRWTVALATLLPVVPVWTLANLTQELFFVWWWSSELSRARARRRSRGFYPSARVSGEVAA